eukprot:m.28330 g.28330  ORF g.28330 m.28330 type:complete len:603 (+) comp8801_c0_seq1:373-2181(+)
MAAANYGVFKVLYLGAGTAATPDQLGMEGVLRSLPPDALSRGQRTLLNIGAEIVVSAWSDGVVLQNWPLESVRVLATAGRMLYFLDTKQDVHFFLAQNQPAAEGIASSVVQARRDARQAHQQGKPVPAGSGTKVDKTKKQKTTPTNQQTTSSNDNLEFDHGFLFEGTRPEQLAQKSRFSRSEIARLNRYFLERCPDGKANPIEFAQMYASLHKSNINDVQEYTDLVFRTFDKDHDGCISFMEYIAFLGLTARGTPREKFELIFDTHDINHDAQLSREEVENMAASIFNLSKVNGYSGPPPPLASGELAELLFSSFDLVSLSSTRTRQGCTWQQFGCKMVTHAAHAAHAVRRLSWHAPVLRNPPRPRRVTLKRQTLWKRAWGMRCWHRWWICHCATDGGPSGRVTCPWPMRWQHRPCGTKPGLQHRLSTPATRRLKSWQQNCKPTNPHRSPSASNSGMTSKRTLRHLRLRRGNGWRLKLSASGLKRRKSCCDRQPSVSVAYWKSSVNLRGSRPRRTRHSGSVSANLSCDVAPLFSKPRGWLLLARHRHHSPSLTSPWRSNHWIFRQASRCRRTTSQLKCPSRGARSERRSHIRIRRMWPSPRR